MSKKDSKETIDNLQNDDSYVVLNSPLASPKFVRAIAKGQKDKETIKLRKNVTANDDIYTPKVFYEIVSKLNPQHLEGIKRTETIKFEIQIKPFLQEIGANVKNYKHLVDSVDALIGTTLKWKEGDKTITTPIISKSIHDEKTGKIELYVDSDLAKHVLELKDKENFSFLKSNIFRLQNAQAIRLYPFFKKWLGFGRYAIDLERFKNDFGYNTSGYDRFNKIEAKILKPAIEEINEKTDIIVSYEVTGDNLNSQRPRVKGLIFTIKLKAKVLQAPKEEQEQEQTRIPPKEKSQANELSTLYTLFTSLKIEPTARLPKETLEATLMQWVDKFGFDNVYSGLMRAKDTYKGTITTPLGFFGGNYFNEYKDYLKNKEQAKQEQEQAKQEKAKEEQQTRKLNAILTDFKTRKRDYFKECFNEQPEDKKATFIQALKEQEGNNPRYFQNGEVTPAGVLYLGEEIAVIQKGYNEGSHLVNFAKKTYNTVLRYNQQGEPFIQE